MSETIYRSVNVLKNLAVDIDVIHAYDEFILLGTRPGNLLLLHVTIDKDNGKRVLLLPYL